MSFSGVFVFEMAKERLARPDCVLASLELIEGGVTIVEVADAPPIVSGKNKGRPNWRKATNEATYAVAHADYDAWLAEYVERTGVCVPCTGQGRHFVRWDHIEGTTWRPCTKCNGTGHRDGIARPAADTEGTLFGDSEGGEP